MIIYMSCLVWQVRKIKKKWENTCWMHKDSKEHEIACLMQDRIWRKSKYMGIKWINEMFRCSMIE
jgi:hypothetical protein